MAGAKIITNHGKAASLSCRRNSGCAWPYVAMLGFGTVLLQTPVLTVQNITCHLESSAFLLAFDTLEEAINYSPSLSLFRRKRMKRKSGMSVTCREVDRLHITTLWNFSC